MRMWHSHTTHMCMGIASICACIHGDATGMISWKSIQRFITHALYTIMLKKCESCTCTQRVAQMEVISADLVSADLKWIYSRLI